MTGIPTLAILWTLLVQHADHWREDQAVPPEYLIGL